MVVSQGCSLWPIVHRERYLRECNALLVSRFGLPRHGNKKNPLDELIYIVLSSQTDESKYQLAYKGLKANFLSWKKIESAEQIAEVLKPAGLSRVKSKHIMAMLETIEHNFGSRTLAPLNRMDEAGAERFLCSLKGVGVKSARCVMMYSFDKQVFPIDTHSFRILKRLGAHNLPLPIRKWHNEIQNLVPHDLRYSLHVTLVSLGRKICKASKPICGNCPIVKYCCTFNPQLAFEGH